MNHHHHHHDDLIDVNAPATAETIIHALSQFHTEHNQGGAYDHVHDQHHEHDQALFNIQDRLTSGNDTGTDDLGGEDETLGGMSRQELEDEVIRLRGLVQAHPVDGNANGIGAGDEITDDTRLLPGPSRKRRKKSTSAVDAAPPVREIQAGTGKRVERDRKTELYKAIRHRMRSVMGIQNESDPLPPPGPRPSGPHLDGISAVIVPDWNEPQSQAVTEWIETVSNGLLPDLLSDHNPFPKVNEEDKDHSIIFEACRVTFANYVKRYKSENDSTHAERKARYAKKRRRWARKDLKQQRRSKARASLDSSHPLAELDQEALLFDYQSSEYSSAGEDSPDDDTTFHERKVAGRAKAWEDARQGKRTTSTGVEGFQTQEEGSPVTGVGGGNEEKKEGYGWAPGLGSKVLEVRTPSWRSAKLNDIYAELDSISTRQSQTRSAPKTSTTRSTVISSTTPSSASDTGVGVNTGSIKSGHVAPSHHRFTLPFDIRRKGSIPRSASGGGMKRKMPTSSTASSTASGKDAVEAENPVGEELDDGKGWMWASGTVGMWPVRPGASGAT